MWLLTNLLRLAGITTPLDLASNVVGVLIAFAIWYAIWAVRAFILASIAYIRLRLGSKITVRRSSSRHSGSGFLQE